MSEPASVVVDFSGPVATATVDRPAARNAMTMAMYEALAEFCARVDDSPEVRVAVVRGAGGTIGDWEGGEDFAPGRVVAAASRELYDRAIELLAS